MPDKKIVISVKDLHKSFGEKQVLDGINLDVYSGETFVIMGPSGCGKSTLLRHLIGALRPDSGQVVFWDQDMASLSESEKDKIRKRFGMSFQSSALLDSLTVEENVALPLKEHTHLDPSIISIIVKMKLSLVGLRGVETLATSMLSGGMRKRVGLARAIAMDPEIVFYDEPTAGLDPVMSAIIDHLILDLSKKLLITSVVVTHDMDSVFRIADRVAMLHKGKVLEVGPPEQIKNSENKIVQQFIKGELEGPMNLVEKEEEHFMEHHG